MISFRWLSGGTARKGNTLITSQEKIKKLLLQNTCGDARWEVTTKNIWISIKSNRDNQNNQSKFVQFAL